MTPDRGWSSDITDCQVSGVTVVPLGAAKI